MYVGTLSLTFVKIYVRYLEFSKYGGVDGFEDKEEVSEKG